MEEEAARRRRLSEKFEDLIEEARSHRGFERFLRSEVSQRLPMLLKRASLSC